MEKPRYFYVGLDLGQAMDYTALAVAERQHDTAGDQRPGVRSPAKAGPPVYDVRHLERFALGTGYPAVVDRVRALLKTPPLAGNYIRLLVDDTGVGAPVVDLLKGAGLRAYPVTVTITAGFTVTRDGDHNTVPKRDLISATKVLLQSGRLRFAEGLPETQTLVKELLAYQPKVDPQTADSMTAWREGVYDDLVLAVAMICWDAVTNYYGPYPLPVRRNPWKALRRR
jgi:hypothetical protein